MTDPVLFLVDNGGTLALANFEAPTSRYEVYEHLVDNWSESPRNLLDAAIQCSPLQWQVNELYENHREGVVALLEQAKSSKDLNNQRITELTERLANLPEDPYDGVDDWLLAISGDEFDLQVVPAIENWFESEPDTIYEGDYISESNSAQGLALEFFQDLDRKILLALGVEIVEGEHPGSSYYAAELRIALDAANELATQLQVPIRFKRG